MRHERGVIEELVKARFPPGGADELSICIAPRRSAFETLVDAEGEVLRLDRSALVHDPLEHRLRLPDRGTEKVLEGAVLHEIHGAILADLCLELLLPVAHFLRHRDGEKVQHPLLQARPRPILAVAQPRDVREGRFHRVGHVHFVQKRLGVPQPFVQEVRTPPSRQLPEVHVRIGEVRTIFYVKLLVFNLAVDLARLKVGLGLQYLRAVGGQVVVDPLQCDFICLRKRLPSTSEGRLVNDLAVLGDPGVPLFDAHLRLSGHRWLFPCWVLLEQ
mmetsp:Transcript_29278/g.76705  ORF Transcript_29278/g.76705 Transcript_29278/m.76705 type:complete len:273 (+) Transcript_29278:448-1266(+)